MSRATSAVAIAPASSRPVVEQAWASDWAALMNDFSWAAPHGKPIDIVLIDGICRAADEKQSTCWLKPTPRGSMPTTSKRSRMALLRKYGAPSAIEVAEPP